MIREFDVNTERIITYGKWKYVAEAFQEYEEFTLEEFEKILRDVEFELEMLLLDEEHEAYHETKHFLDFALQRIRNMLEYIQHLQVCEVDSEQYRSLYDGVLYAFVALIYRDQKRSEESLEIVNVKEIMNEALYDYDISMDGIILEAPDESEIIYGWLKDSFLTLTKEQQANYYTELASKIKHIHLVNSCERYNLNLAEAVQLINSFRQSIVKYINDLEHREADEELRSDIFAKSILIVFSNYHEYLIIPELSSSIKWLFKFLIEQRKKSADGYVYLVRPEF